MPPQLWRFSLAGVALKFSLLRQGDRFTAPGVGQGGDWIAKLPHPFNVLIGNGDAHLKNWSLIYRDPRVPTLSPAYDLVATAVYRPAQLGKEDLGLRFGRDRRFESVRLGHFAALDEKLSSKAGLGDLVVSFTRSVTEAWPAAAELLADHDHLRRGIEGWVTERSRILM